MSNTVLITRASGDGEELTNALHSAGHNVIHEPLTDIILQHTVRTELAQALEADPDGVLVTSRHGVRALAALTELRDLPVLCVGEATLEAAESTGFSRAYATGSTVDDMLDYVRSAYDEDACFLYASAEHIRTDIVEALEPHGIRVQRIVVYEAQAVETLSEILTEHIKNGQIDAVTFLSQRAAQIFQQLSKDSELSEPITGMQACCISEAVAAALDEEAWAAIHIASEPTLASIAKCVDNALR